MTTPTTRILAVCLACLASVDAFSARLSRPVAVARGAPSKTQLFVSSVKKPIQNSTAWEEDPPAVVTPPPNNDNDKLLPALAPEDAWIADLDYEGFGREVNQLGKDLLKETSGEENVQHLQKMLTWQNALAFAGVFSLWTAPNPFTVVCLSTWQFSSWLMIAHHTQHGGYNRFDAGKFNSRIFALGTLQRRILDWLDWIQPEAWNLEHNRLHHYRLNELADPDYTQRNSELLRSDAIPGPGKYLGVLFLMTTWRWSYYASNTYKELRLSETKPEDLPDKIRPTDCITITSMLAPSNDNERAMVEFLNPTQFFWKVMGPFFFLRFVLLPLPLLAISPTLFTNALINLALAEVLTNVHSFMTVVTNHAGEDLYAFKDAVKPRSPSFYVRQVVGSTNMNYGNDVVDFWHGFLNYQIEHHVWPDFSMLQLQKGAPRLKAICEKYGVPYAQENTVARTIKTANIIMGKASMREFPTEYEPARDKATTIVGHS